MVIGNPSLRSPPATGGASITDLADGVPQPVQWVCPRSNTAEPLYPTDSDGLNGVGIQDPSNSGAGVGFPDQNCDGYASPLRADIHFPSCYDPSQGLDAYKTNMRFPTNGNCPEGWEHKPHLFYEVYWNTPLFANEWTQGQGKQPFVLANGDPTGYSLHADFIAGWDVPTLQQVIDNCDAGDSGMDKCPGLIGGLNDPSTSCNIPSAVNEVIDGDLTKLPGNNPLGQWGVAPAGGSSPAPTTTSAASPTSSVTSVNHVVTVPATSQTSSPATFVTSYVAPTTTTAAPAQTSPATSSSVAAGWSYYGCYSDNLNARVLTGIQFADIGNHEVTNTKCVAYCAAKGYSLAGTEYGGQCFCDNKLTGSSAIDESKCNMPCEGDSTETCGGSVALSVYSTSAATKTKARKQAHQRFRGASHSHY